MNIRNIFLNNLSTQSLKPQCYSQIIYLYHYQQRQWTETETSTKPYTTQTRSRIAIFVVSYFVKQKLGVQNERTT